MKRIALTAVALLCLGAAHSQNIPEYHDTEVEASREYIEGNAYQKDLLLYADMLGDTHPTTLMLSIAQSCRGVWARYIRSAVRLPK